MITGLNHITLSVKDLEISFTFYRDILGFMPRAKWHEGAYFEIGNLWFCLFFDPLTRKSPLLEYTHLAFDVSEVDFLKISKRIQSSGALLWKENKSEGKSLYFLDPSGHKLEVHVGTLETRLAAKKKNPGRWKDIEWFV